MPMPDFLPAVYGEPDIPAGYVFVICTLAAPTDLCPSGTVIMGWPKFRRNEAGGPFVQYLPTPEAVEARIADEGHTVIRWRIVTYADLPKDRTYRDAMIDDGLKLSHDITHAREIHRTYLRVARGPKLAALDVDYQRADEMGETNDKRRIAEAKQLLRDLPALPEINAAQTVEALKAVWPDELT